MAAKKDKMIPSEKERKRALKYATPAGTGRMWVTMGIAFIIFGIILLLIPIGLCRVGSIHLCSTDAMTPEIDIRRIKNPRDVKEVLSKTIEACRKANGIRTSEIIGDHGHFPEPAPHGMPPEPCHEHPHN